MRTAGHRVTASGPPRHDRTRSGKAENRAGPTHTAGHTAGFGRLGELNGTGAKGAVRLHVRGSQVDVTGYASGLLRRAPHAMHFHAGGAGTCPPRDTYRG